MKRILLAVLTCLAVLVLAACGGDDNTDTGGGDLSDDTSETAINQVDVTMQEYAFAVEGQAAAGPLTLMFHNEGEEIHHGILGKLDEGKTLDDVKKLLAKDSQGPPPPWFDDTPIDMTLVSPGESSGITIDAEEGTYVLLCFMPDPEGQPHVSHGMAQSFDVVAGEEVDAPEPDASLSMTQEGIEAPEGLTGGTSVIEVTNDSEVDMETFVAQIAEGSTFEDIEPWFNEGQKGQPPATFYGGTHTFAPGESVLLTVELEPGDYNIVATYEPEKGPIEDLPTEFTVGE